MLYVFLPYFRDFMLTSKIAKCDHKGNKFYDMRMSVCKNTYTILHIYMYSSGNYLERLSKIRFSAVPISISHCKYTKIEVSSFWLSPFSQQNLESETDNDL